MDAANDKASSPTPSTPSAPSMSHGSTAANVIGDSARRDEEFSGAVIDAFVSLADTLVTDYDPADLLTHLVERAVHLLDVTAAGILLADATGALRVAAASSTAMAHLELFQLENGRGPCLQCFRTTSPVAATGPGQAQRRWPRFAAAMDAHGLRSVVAVPLRLREQTLGVMGMFADRWQVPTPAAVRIAQGMADVATIALLQDRAVLDSRALAAQLQGALDSRVLIEQAKGVVAAQLGTTVSDAFLILRSTARRRGVKLVDLCQALVEGRSDATELDT